MDLIGNIAPIAVGLLACAVAWVSVRRAYRKASDRPSAPTPVPPTAAE